MISNQYYTNIIYNKQMEDLLDKAYKKYVIWKEVQSNIFLFYVCLKRDLFFFQYNSSLYYIFLMVRKWKFKIIQLFCESIQNTFMAVH